MRLTVSPSLTWPQGPKSTAPTLSDSRLSASPVTSCGSSSISNDMAVLEAVDARDAVGHRQDRADLGEVRLARVEALDAALEDGRDLVRLDLHGWLSLAP